MDFQEDERMLTIEQLIATGQVRSAAWSPDGDQIAFVWQRDGVNRLFAVPSGGGFPELLSPHAIAFDSPEAAPSWSPCGRHLLYLCAATGGVNLWTVPAAGGAPKRITRGPGKETAPRWSPDGKQVAFITDRDGHDQIALVDVTAEGGAAGWPRALVRAEVDCRDPRWSPDGRFLAFQALEAMDSHAVCTVEVATGEVRRVYAGPEISAGSPRWSPDGSKLLCVSDANGFANLWLIDLTSGSVESLTEGHEEKGAPAWTSDGERVAYTFCRQGSIGIGVADLSSRKAQAVVAPTGVAADPVWSPDGSKLLYLYHDYRQAPELFVKAVDGPALQLTFSMPRALAGAGMVEPELVEYASTDGMIIPAFLYRPPQAAGGGKFPIIVYPHGGPTAQHTNGWHPWLQYFILKGYGVIAPNFRGSTGYGRAFELANREEWGKKDLEDVLQAAAYARTVEWVDPKRVAIFGGSYGGYQALLALSKAPGSFCCGVDFYGVSNRFSSWRDTDRIGKRNIQRKLGKPNGNAELYKEASPLFYEANIREPLLIMHGEADPRVPFGQSVEIAEALRRRGFPVQFYGYPGEGHGFLKPEHLRDIYTKVEQFFDLYL